MSGEEKYTLPACREHGDAVLLKIRAQPAASRDGVQGVRGDALKVCVTAVPREGKANAAVEKVVARALRVRRAQVRLYSGPASREKWLLVEGMDLKTIEAALRVLVEGTDEGRGS